MKRCLLTIASLTLFGFATPMTQADEGHPHRHHEGRHGRASAAGEPGNADKVDRMVEIRAMDTMQYDKPRLNAKAGETIKFVVTNIGKVRHEFSIGTAAEQHEHAEMMKQMPDMVHADANMITVEPGETKSLVWQFTRTGTVEIACHIPGHYEAGMKSKVTVVR